jgi:molybdenum cofactor biosynthesis protein B
MGHNDHRANAPRLAAVAVLSVSSSRSLDTDTSGHWIAEQAQKEGHRVVAHQVVPDEKSTIKQTVLHILAEYKPSAIIVTGGTGISPKDLTIEALQPLFIKELTSFGSLFAHLSHDQVGAAAMISRATAGIIGSALVFCLPGSLKACQLACQALIFPELGHLLAHISEV